MTDTYDYLTQPHKLSGFRRRTPLSVAVPVFDQLLLKIQRMRPCFTCEEGMVAPAPLELAD